VLNPQNSNKHHLSSYHFSNVSSCPPKKKLFCAPKNPFPKKTGCLYVPATAWKHWSFVNLLQYNHCVSCSFYLCALYVCVGKHIRAGKWLRKKLSFLKSLKVQNLGFLGFLFFLVKFYTDHIKFHILIVICEFCCILQKTLWQRIV